MRVAGKLGLAAALLLATGQVDAVDVDRIEIHSRLGEPLVAEIPIVGASAGELAQIQAQLASPTTFARIGLPRPQGVVAGLRFEVVRGPRPMIRVTSAEPVQEEFLTFLMQVDAPQGRLVREYSLALGAAPSFPADMAPVLQAPTAAPAATIARQSDPAEALPVLVAPQVEVAPAAAPPIAVIGSANAPRAAAAAPVPLAGDRVSAREPAVIAATARPAAQRTGGSVPGARPNPPGQTALTRVREAGGFKVERGDTLTRMVGRMGIGQVTEQQAMLAVLRTNPQAFAGGNINRLEHGAVLRTPGVAELTRLAPAAAEALVRQHTAQWRSGDLTPIAVPAALPAVAEAVAPIPVTADATAPARLEIAAADPETAMPDAPGATTSGSGASDGARAAADLVAARYTEFQQMQQRIVELEQTQVSQQRLLALQERQLAGQRPQVAGTWPWLIASLVLGAALTAAWRSRVSQGPGRIAKALAWRVRGAGAPAAGETAR